MPFKSEAQRRWMYANHPEMAKRWEKETHGKLSEHAGHHDEHKPNGERDHKKIP